MEREISNKRKRVFSPSMSTLTTESTSRKKRKITVQRGPYMTDATLLPNGLYAAHLHDPIDHFPVDVEITKEDKNVAQKQPKCNLHSWYGGQNCQSRYKVMHCMKCDVNLCIHCYKLFHTEPKLVQIKELLKQAYDCDHNNK